MVRLPNDKNPAETEERRTEVKKIIIAVLQFVSFHLRLPLLLIRKTWKPKTVLERRGKLIVLGPRRQN